MPERSFTASVLWDRFGVGVSVICAIHCLALPVLITILPLWPLSHSFFAEWLHPLLIGLLIPVVYFAARRSHFNRWITVFLISGMGWVIFGWLLGHYWLGLWVESVLTIVGSFLMIAGHWMNYRHHRVCRNKHHRHHPVTESEMDKQNPDDETAEFHP